MFQQENAGGVSTVKVRVRSRYVALASVAVAAPLWAACGSSGGASAQAATSPALCQKILGVLSDGPDPDVDPVGYALSQIKPLTAIHTSNHSVGTTLDELIVADGALVTSNGSSKTAKTAIKGSDKALNKACPEVAS